TIAAAAKGCEQVLMIGDPGPIGPVTTADTSIFDDADYPPHGRAPDVRRAHPSAKVLHLPTSYRLVARTVEAITQLYDFPFDSGRHDRTVTGHEEIESVQIDRDDPVDLYADVAQLAQSFIGQNLTSDDGTRALTPNDVAVVAGDNQA